MSSDKEAKNKGPIKQPKGIDIEKLTLIIDKFEVVTMTNLMPIVVELMQAVAEIPKLRGTEKKALVIDALRYMVDVTDAGSWDKFDPVIRELIPLVIDSMLEVNKGKLTFKPILPKGCCA